MTAADVPVHGHQEGRFFHGFYDHHCFCRSMCSAASSVHAQHLIGIEVGLLDTAVPICARTVLGLGSARREDVILVAEELEVELKRAAALS